MSDWLVVGIGGATCAGKTTLASRLKEALEGARVEVASQDDYALPPDDPRHLLVPEIGHKNWELLTSIDSDRMVRDVREILAEREASDGKVTTPRILILEGFLLFHCRELADLCDLRYFLEIDETECRERRERRIYEPPDVPRYFDLVVWPEYLKATAEIRANEKLSREIVFIDTANSSADDTLERVHGDVMKRVTM